MSEVLGAAKELAKQSRTRIAEIDRRIPAIDQEVAKLNGEKHDLQDERRKIQGFQKMLDFANGNRARERNGDRGRRRQPRPTRQVPDAELLKAVAAADSPITTRAVAAHLGVDARTIRFHLQRLRDAQQIAGSHDGWTAAPAAPEQ